jgi:hypothetical protein
LAAEIVQPLEVIVSQMVAIKRKLGDTPPVVAAEYYKKQHPKELPMKLVKTVIDEMLLAKRGDGSAMVICGTSASATNGCGEERDH